MKKIFIFFLGAVCGIGFLGVGYVAYKKSAPLILKIKTKLKERYIASIPKAKETLTLLDFETPADLTKLYLENTKTELSFEHPTSGKSSAKLVYLPANGISSVGIKKYFEKEKKLSDWSHYDILAFDVFNPGSSRERIILQIKDDQNDSVKIGLNLDPAVNNHVEVDVSRLWDNLDPSKIVQFNLFLWDNRSEKVFYLDNIRLLPAAIAGRANVNIADEKFIPKAGEHVYAVGDYFAFDAGKWTRKDNNSGVSFIEFPLILAGYPNEKEITVPFTGGIPFARGQLFSLGRLILVDADGRIVPFQAKITAKWPDLSIKWAIITFKASCAQKYFLRYSKLSTDFKPVSKISLQDMNEEIIVDTGVLKFKVNKKKFGIFNGVWLDENKNGVYQDSEMYCGAGEMVLAHNKKEYLSTLDKETQVKVEDTGPLKAVIKAQGWFVNPKGEKFCRFIVRISAYAGESYLKIQHTFVYTGYPENKVHYLYKGKNLPRNETIDAIYLKFAGTNLQNSKFTFSGDRKILQGDLTDTLKFIQNDSNQFGIGKNSSGVKPFGEKLAG
ncbi:MAG: hypothetical protein PHY94_08435, partial [Candidatus Omnitrophica bacterium]|nr:hypothetical protein [Candidatus Omnitrophota bacterium]